MNIHECGTLPRAGSEKEHENIRRLITEGSREGYAWDSVFGWQEIGSEKIVGQLAEEMCTCAEYGSSAGKKWAEKGRRANCSGTPYDHPPGT